ncbi:MAG TPA: hypothetical protein VF596_09605 [Pyrinomonadaceae bacterium]|jgi:hypothetical protein
MIAKVLLSLVALITGGWMIFDGAYVLLTGNYFGTEKPGAWSDVVSAFGINPFNLGVPFIILGFLWFSFLVGVLFHQPWAWYGALYVAIATLWYLPVGTVLSLVYITLLFVFRSKLQA